MRFGYEDLQVWERAVQFAVTVIDVIDDLQCDRKHFRLIEQIESSATSVSANIAEGKGRRSQKEFIQFCYISRGSLYETMTFLEIFHHKGWINTDTYKKLRSEAYEIASMLKGLINSLN
ncbi:four helix bundle protein [Desulfonatronovibrio magnus]|uniref:four helix bundle protein n=1 Tax=Desulfonatronovibrio magnus TaxID=698827 RepID=UPI0005EB986C|nr:four helix bundle protein [Desulfonatronovibrio magnus]